MRSSVWFMFFCIIWLHNNPAYNQYSYKRDCCLIVWIAARTPHIAFARWTSLFCPCIGRSACSRGRCCGCQHPVSSVAYFVGVCSFRVLRMARHCTQELPKATGLCRSRRTVCTSSSGLDVAVCHPVPSSSTLHCTVPPAATDDPIRRKDYHKLWIIHIIQRQTLSKATLDTTLAMKKLQWTQTVFLVIITGVQRLLFSPRLKDYSAKR